MISTRLCALALAFFVHGVVVAFVILSPPGRASISFDQPALFLQLGQGKVAGKNGFLGVSQAHTGKKSGSQGRQFQAESSVIALGSPHVPAILREPMDLQGEELNGAEGQRSNAGQEEGGIPVEGMKGETSGRAGGIYETSFGSGDGPGFLTQARLNYPMGARRAGREGVVVLLLKIDHSGRLQDVFVTQSAGFGMDEEALRMVRRSTFRPALRNGTPVTCQGRLPVRFQLIPN